MSDTLTVNDLVTQHAEKENGNGGQSQTTTTKEEVKQGDDNSSAGGESDLKAELEKLRKENEELKKAPAKPQAEKVKTPEELANEKVVYEANLIQYAATNGDLKPEDFSKLTTLQSKADQDLVFEKFAADHKEDNPEADDDEIRTAFNDEYKIKNTNEKSRNRGAERLKKEADDLRAPLSNSYNNVKGKFDTENEIRQNFPAFSKKVEELATASIPQKIEAFKDKDGEEDVIVDFDLTEAQRKDIAEKVSKKMNTPKTYALYKAGKLEDIQKKTKEITDSIIWIEYRQDAIKKVATTYNDRGIKRAKVGPNHPFPLTQENKTGGQPGGFADAESEVLSSLQGKK